MATKTPKLRGEVKILPLNSVKPNSWNPNEMTPEMRESLKHGLCEDGWLVSQALLIWGSDENGDTQNIIIDGEHRFEVAVELGMKKGPMVLLDGISKVEAEKLTIKLNQKRGDWNLDALAKLLKEIAETTPDGLSAVDMGFTDEALMKLLAAAPEVAAPGEGFDPGAAPPPSEDPAGGGGGEPTTSNVRMVQLFLDDKTHPAFLEKVKALAEKWGTKNVTDTTLKAIEFCAGLSDELLKGA